MSTQQHPDYHDGFFDAIDQAPDRLEGCSTEYRAGWDAGSRSREILSGAGLQQNSRDFSASATLPSADRAPPEGK